MKPITPCQRPSRRQLGFTLIEMMVAIAVAAVLLSIAVPSFHSFIVNNRMTSQINGLVASISRARNEAALRGVQVTICASSDGVTCATSTTGWQIGWLIFVDSNNNGVLDAAEGRAIATEAALDSGSTLTATGFANNARLVFRPYGGLLTTSGTFTLCPQSPDKNGRQVSVALSGRPNASKYTCP